MEDNPSTSPSSSGVDHDQWDVRSETDNSSSLSLMTRSDPTELPHSPVSHSHGDIPESPPPHEESPSAPPQPKEIDDSAELHPPMSNIQQSAIAVEDPASCPPLGTDSGNDYQSALRARGEGRDQQSPESDGSSMLSYVTLGHVPAVPATRSQSDIPGSIHSHKDDSSVPAQESHELPKAPRASDTQCPISLHADSPRASQTSSAPEARDDPRWNEWREWREWKMEQEWQEFRRWEEGRKRNNVQASHTANTDEQRAESAGEQAQLVPTQAAVNPMVTPEQSEEKGGVRTEYVLSGQPTGWAAIDKVLRDFDEEKVKYCKEDIDTLLVFAGLFSAVLTAFLIESYQNLTANESSNNGSSGNSSASHPSDGQPAAPFQPSSADIRVNVLWFASLLFSLISASFGILVKQWLREYMAVQNPSPQARLRLRHLRYPQLDKWKVFEIAAVLPLLLQLSLSLFFIGLCYFTAAVHSSIGYTTLPLVIGWALCFLIAAFLPLLSPRCPYRITLLKGLISRVHRAWVNQARRVRRNLIDQLPEEQQGQLYYEEPCIKSASLWKVPKLMHSILWPAVGPLTASDENEVVQRADGDLSILADADAVQSNDELLSTSIVEAVKQIERKSYSSGQFLAFLYQILANRLAVPEYQGPELKGNACRLCIDLRTTSLPSRSIEGVLDITHNYLRLTYQEHCSLSLGDGLSLSESILVLLFSMSGRSIHDIPHLSTIFGQLGSSHTLAEACREIPSYLNETEDTHFRAIRTDRVKTILQLRHQSGASWSPFSFIHRTLQSVRHGRSDPFEKSKVEDSLQVHAITAQQLATLGSKFFGIIDNWRSYDHVIQPTSIAELLRAEVEWYTQSEGKIDVESSKCSFGQSIHPAALQFAIAFLCIHISSKTYSWWSCWSWINPRQPQNPDASAFIMLIAVCLCVPTSCLIPHRLASKDYDHVKALESQVAMHDGAWQPESPIPDISVSKMWPSALSCTLEDPIVHSHASAVLKLLVFSLYVLELDIFGMLLPAERLRWAPLFRTFAQNIQQLSVQEQERREVTSLATVCLEILRYLEILACGREKHTPTGVFDWDIPLSLPANWEDPKWRDFYLSSSIFPEALIKALEPIAQPFWHSELPRELSTSEETSLTHISYCEYLERRINGIM